MGTLAAMFNKNLINLYDSDVLMWSKQQSALIREGSFSEVDWQNVAEEIQDVGRSAERDFAKRLADLVALLLELDYSDKGDKTLPGRIELAKKTASRIVLRTPSFSEMLESEDWQESIFGDGMLLASQRAGIEMNIFPEKPIWNLKELLSGSRS